MLSEGAGSRDHAGMPRDSDPGRALAPMLATATDALPRGSGWAFEPKWDGYRALVRVAAGEATLRSRNGNDLTTRFPAVARRARPRGTRAGEPCSTARSAHSTTTGRSDFGRLQRGEGALVLRRLRPPRARRRAAAAPHATWSGGASSRDSWTPSVAGVLLSPSFDDGAALEQAAREHGLEGVVAKRVASTYQPGRRSPDWRKLKLKQRQEAVIAGFTRGKGRRSSRDRRARARGARPGRIALRGQRRNRAQRHASSTVWRSSSPRSDKRTAHLSRHRGFHACVEGRVTWVEPLLVAEIEFAEWNCERRAAEGTGLPGPARRQACRGRRRRARPTTEGDQARSTRAEALEPRQAVLARGGDHERATCSRSTGTSRRGARRTSGRGRSR